MAGSDARAAPEVQPFLMYLVLYLSMRLFSCLLMSLALYLLMRLLWTCGTCPGTLLCPCQSTCLCKALVCVPVEQHFKHVNQP